MRGLVAPASLSTFVRCFVAPASPSTFVRCFVAPASLSTFVRGFVPPASLSTFVRGLVVPVSISVFGFPEGASVTFGLRIPPVSASAFGPQIFVSVSAFGPRTFESTSAFGPRTFESASRFVFADGASGAFGLVSPSPIRRSAIVVCRIPLVSTSAFGPRIFESASRFVFPIPPVSAPTFGLFQKSKRVSGPMLPTSLPNTVPWLFSTTLPMVLLRPPMAPPFNAASSVPSKASRPS